MQSQYHIAVITAKRFGWIYPSSKRRLIQRTSVCRRFLQARMPLFKILEKFAPLIILSSAE